jgi:DNA-binding GntR family transcriptional regulator
MGNLIQSSSDIIANKIRTSIIVGEFSVGLQLKQDKLAEQYKVSKIPVREALNQLKTEGLVEFANNRGSRVTSLSCLEVEEIYTLRIALEEIALNNAIANLKEEDFIKAESVLRLLDISNDYINWPKLNWEFHSIIYQAAQMPKLLDIVSILHNNVTRYLLLYLKKMDFQRVSQDEHWELLKLCKQKKSEQAVKLLKSHMKEALNVTLIHMKEN